MKIAKTTQFRHLLRSHYLEFLMEAHNGLSAKIVEEAGFKGIWGSSLSIAAALGVRDNNEASWTQVLDVLEFMSDATTIPILMDGDTGYGNFNNVRRLVKKLEQRGVAAVCFEDKLFPKTNSFIDSERQPMADIEEFCGKIKAAKDAQEDEDFCVVARIESLIVGWGLGEALSRAEAYWSAGADALLIHSKKSSPEEILAFMSGWGHTCPVIIAPTTYYGTPTRIFEDAGVRVVIWANQMLRSSIAAMQVAADRINRERSVMGNEDTLVTMAEVFRLQAVDELQEAEKRYLPQQDGHGRAIVLAASQGEGLGHLTENKPKAMLQVMGEPLLAKLVRHFNDTSIKDITVVVGYKPEAVDLPGIKTVLNPDYDRTMEVYSLYKAREALSGPVVISYGDILFKSYILMNLLNERGDIVIVVDGSVTERNPSFSYRDYVRCSKPYTREYFEETIFLQEMSPELPAGHIHGEWIGLLSLSGRGAQKTRDAVDKLSLREEFPRLRMKDLFAYLIAQGEQIHVVYVSGHWLDLDDLDVLAKVMDF